MSKDAGKLLSATDTEPILTLKERKFLQIWLKLGNSSEAASQVYKCKNRVVAGAIGTQTLAKLRNPVLLLMEKRGLSMGKLLDVLEDGLKATKPTDHGGEVEDYAVRHKYMESMARWLKVETPETVPPTTQNTQVNFFAIPNQEQKTFNEGFKGFLRDFYSKVPADATVIKE